MRERKDSVRMKQGRKEGVKKRDVQYHILSVGGGGMLMARVPESSRTSTLSIRGMLDTSAIFFLMYSFSVAFWKYLDFAILSTNLKIFLPVLPPVCLRDESDKGDT